MWEWKRGLPLFARRCRTSRRRRRVRPGSTGWVGCWTPAARAAPRWESPPLPQPAEYPNEYHIIKTILVSNMLTWLRSGLFDKTFVSKIPV